MIEKLHIKVSNTSDIYDVLDALDQKVGIADKLQVVDQLKDLVAALEAAPKNIREYAGKVCAAEGMLSLLFKKDVVIHIGHKTEKRLIESILKS